MSVFSNGYLSAGQATTALLNLFQPLPEKGTIEVPAVMIQHGKEGSIPLTDENAANIQESIRAVVHEAKEMREREARWGLGRQIPIQRTVGEWFVDGFPDEPAVSFDHDAEINNGMVKGREASGLNIISKGGKYVRLDSRVEGTEITVGWDRPLARAYQTMFIDGGLHVWTSWYAVDFLGSAVEGLRNFLEKIKSPQIELGVELTNRIYNSNHYERHELKAPQLRLPEKKPIPLVWKGNRWILPEGHRIDSEKPQLDIVSLGTVIPKGRKKFPEPFVEISSDVRDRKDDFIDIWLRYPKSSQVGKGMNSHLVKLNGTLLEIWEGALTWAFSRAAWNWELHSVE